MRLRHYIKGSRRGKEANRLEREAMKDPFLAEALEGYERMPDAHVERIDVMRKRISANTRKRHKTIYNWSVAACIIAVFGLGGYFLLHKTEYPLSSQIAQQIVKEDQIEQIAPPPPAPVSITEDAVVEIEAISEEIAAPMAMAADTDIAIADEEILEEEAEIAAVTQTATLSKQSRSLAKERAPIVMPHPVIGDKAYLEYIKENLIRPTDEECKEVKGRVIISFQVNEKGRPYDLIIVRSLCPSLDKEAIRLIEKGPDWTVGDQPYTLPISFQ